MKTKRNITNQEIAKLLRAISAAYEIKGGNKFKIMAYDRAATAIEHATSEAKDLWDDSKLTEIPGVGASIAAHLDELFRKGKVAYFEQIMKGLPLAMFELLNVPRIGAKSAYKLCRELKIKNPQTAVLDLEKAAKKGKIAKIEGFGQKSQEDILEAIKVFKAGEIKENRMVLPYADAIAQEMISYLKKIPATIRADPLGSLRRKVATIGDVDVAVSTLKPVEVINWFVRYPKARKIVEKGPSGATILLKNGRQVDLRVQNPKAYGAMLQYFTGSKHHNIHLRELALKKGFSLSEYGIKKIKNLKLKIKNYESEEDFYKALRLPWIPPELREDTGEIEAALRQAQGKPDGLPKLVELEDVKGDLHIHSNFPVEESHDPGLDPMEEIIKVASSLGYNYIGFTEHNPSQSQHSENQIMSLLKRKKEAIDKINCSRVKKLLKGVFNGLEIDIKPNGELAIPKKALYLLDYGIASIHSSFNMKRDQMTKRVLRALDYPKIKIFGHPTGRKLGQREGYELDWEKIFEFCKRHDKWLEINAWPDRLDLPDALVREAVKNGVKMVICTDAHAKNQLTLMSYGVAVARRGWAEKKDIINTLSYDKIVQELKGGEK
jgi:DNA polymerase (family 10)